MKCVFGACGRDIPLATAPEELRQQPAEWLSSFVFKDFNPIAKGALPTDPRLPANAVGWNRKSIVHDALQCCAFVLLVHQTDGVEGDTLSSVVVYDTWRDAPHRGHVVGAFHDAGDSLFDLCCAFLAVPQDEHNLSHLSALAAHTLHGGAQAPHGRPPPLSTGFNCPRFESTFWADRTTAGNRSALHAMSLLLRRDKKLRLWHSNAGRLRRCLHTLAFVLPPDALKHVLLEPLVGPVDPGLHPFLPDVCACVTDKPDRHAAWVEPPPGGTSLESFKELQEHYDTAEEALLALRVWTLKRGMEVELGMASVWYDDAGPDPDYM